MAAHDNDNDHDNDKRKNEGKPVVAAPAAGAITSLAALETALNSVDTASVVGRSGLPMLQFKREGDGTWLFGQKRTVVEDGSRWAVNPLSFKYGYICFSDGNKVLGERLASVSQPMPDVATLPDKGFPWSAQWCVNLAPPTAPTRHRGLQANHYGGIKSVGFDEEVRDRSMAASTMASFAYRAVYGQPPTSAIRPCKYRC
jgi:hypothetical protein